MDTCDLLDLILIMVELICFDLVLSQVANLCSCFSELKHGSLLVMIILTN